MTDAQANKRAIQELLSEARKEGKPDPYVGKRRWTRYKLGIPFEVTSDPNVLGASWRVISHNISGGGMGFWSKQAPSPGDALFVRECSEDEPTEWLSSHVNYCVLGVNGYLVGLSFDHPADPDAVFDLSRLVLPAEPEDARPEAKRPRTRIPLARQCAYACAASSGIMLGCLALFNQYRPEWQATPQLSFAASLLAIFLSGLLAWVLVRRESGLLRQLGMAIKKLASNSPCTFPLPKASSPEIETIRQAILDLGLRWKQHADSEHSHRERLEEINLIKTNILSTVSHDLRTPLTSIQLYAKMLQEDLKRLEEAESKHFLEVISEESDRLSRLLNELLEVQRLEGGTVQWKLESHDLSETIFSVAGAFTAVASHQGISFEVECPDVLPKIEVDPDKIAQVINNLLSNALKFTPAKGTIRLIAEVRQTDLLISVIDTGPGIPRDKWDVIFDRFSQLPTTMVRSSGGAGLGLHIVRQIVERHGGIVWVDSEVGRGSEFDVSLPLTRPDKGSSTKSGDKASLGTAVVCDADPALAASIAGHLRNDGLDVRTANSGRRLLEHLSQNLPDIVIADLTLPDMTAMDLFEALKTFKTESFALLVHSFDGDYAELKSKGADFVLRRPATREQLIQAVRLAIHKHRDSGQVILLVGGWGIDCDQLSQHLAVLGEIPLIASDTKAAIEYLKSCSIDLVVVKASAGGYLSNDLHRLKTSADNSTRIVVLGDPMFGNEYLSGDAEGIVYLPYSRGHEEETAAAIVAARQKDLQEPVS